MHDLILTVADAASLLATRTRAARRRRGWTQAELAGRAGVSLATITRLEGTGTAQLANFLRVMAALGHLADVDALLDEPEPTSMDELRRRAR